MKKGFAYLTALLLLSLLLSAAAFFTRSTVHWRRMLRQDLAGIQARQMAQNAVVYYAAQQPALPRHEFQFDRADLFTLAGLDYALEQQGFRIVAHKNNIYYIGYAGNLSAPQAAYILYTVDGGSPKPWRE